MATSGDYRNIRIFDDMEMSHTTDPVSGVPSEYDKKSVSVISTSGMSRCIINYSKRNATSKTIEFANTKKTESLICTGRRGSPKLIFL